MFALIDCNNFFVSCERLFAPALAQKPLVILSSNDGCIVARCNYAKACGIKMGSPYFKAKADLIKHSITWRSSNFSLYSNISARVLGCISQKFDKVQQYSVDEAFLDFADMPVAQIVPAARDLAEYIMRCTSIPVSIGIAPSKVLCKAATELLKKGVAGDKSVLFWDESKSDLLLSSIAVEDIWGIGRKLAPKLRLNEKIGTAADMKMADAHYLRSKYGLGVGRIIRELNGEACSAVAEDDTGKENQQILRSRSFSERICDPNLLSVALAQHATRAVDKLRANGQMAGTLEVFISTSRFVPAEKKYRGTLKRSFNLPTDNLFTVLRQIKQMLPLIYKPNYQYARCGICLSELSKTEKDTGRLFINAQQQKLDGFYAAMQRVNRRHGKNRLEPARMYVEREQTAKWRAKSAKASQNYLTDWDQLPKVG